MLFDFGKNKKKPEVPRFDEEDRFCRSIAEDVLGEVGDGNTFNREWASISVVKPYLAKMKEQLSQETIDAMTYEEAKKWLLENTDIRTLGPTDHLTNNDPPSTEPKGFESVFKSPFSGKIGGGGGGIGGGL